MTLETEIADRNRRCWFDWQLRKALKETYPDALSVWHRGVWTFFQTKKLERAQRWLFKLRAARAASLNAKRMFPT